MALTLRGWIHYKLRLSSLGKDEQAHRDFALWLVSSVLHVDSLTELSDDTAKTIREELYPLEDDELEQKIIEWRSSYAAQQVNLEDLIEKATLERTQVSSSPRIETPQQTEYKPGMPIPNDFELHKKLENHKLYHLTAFGVLFTVVRRGEQCTWAAQSTLEGPDGYGTGSLEQFFDWYRRNATREERAAAMPDWDDLESLEYKA